jgi:ribulose-phosphate 3-epimerase
MDRPNVIIFKTPHRLAESAVELIVRTGREAIDQRGRFLLVLAGGSTPEKTYELLAEPQRASALDWTKTYVFFDDERLVPPDDPRSNYRMARRTLLERVPLPASQVFPIATAGMTAAQAAAAYVTQLARFFPEATGPSLPRFDLILLGLGEDGHTASLFPGAAALQVQDAWVAGTPPGRLPPPVDRVTLTYPVLNAARQVAFLVAGQGKASVVRAVIEGEKGDCPPLCDPLCDWRRYPAAGIRPTDGTLTWLLDEAAARELSAVQEEKGKRMEEPVSPGGHAGSEDSPDLCKAPEQRVTVAIFLAPSILAADFARLGQQVLEAEQAGASRIHVDVMDGRFVPNLSLGPAVVASLRPVTRLPLEVHLMVERPESFLEAFAKAGADTLIVQQESTVHLHRAVQQVKSLGKRAGVALNPATPAMLLEEILPYLDLVLVMTVNPGFGGQDFIPGTLAKIRQVRQCIDRVQPACELEVDGGIEPHTAAAVVEAGARVLVAGSAIFRCPEGVAAGMARLRAAAGSGR